MSVFRAIELSSQHSEAEGCQYWRGDSILRMRRQKFARWQMMCDCWKRKVAFLNNTLSVMPSLERVTIGVLSATLIAYLGAAGHRYFILNTPVDRELFFLAFVFILRAKIGLDDIHYYASEAKQSTHVSYAIFSSLFSYVLWVLIPFQLFSNLELGVLLTSVTILVSTSSIAFTGIGLENALKRAKGDSKEVASTYTQFKRFYDEQPYWIISNCIYEFLLLMLIYFDAASGIAFFVVIPILIIAVVHDALRSDAIAYIAGVRKSGFPIFCSKQHYLGSSADHDAFCPICGGAAEITNNSDAEKH